MTKCHLYGEDTGADTTVIRYLIPDDGVFGSIHNETDVSFDVTDFYIGFISSENIAGAVIVVVNKRFDTDSGSFTVFHYLLVENGDVVLVSSIFHHHSCRIGLKRSSFEGFSCVTGGLGEKSS